MPRPSSSKRDRSGGCNTGFKRLPALKKGVRSVLAATTIGVIGSGTAENDDLARPLGELLAALGVNLLTGGGLGAMAAVCRAYTRAPRTRGISIGVLPCRSESERTRPRDGYPNEFVELAIYTHLPYSGEQGTSDLSRNHIIVLSSAAIVALPGSAGTASEIALARRYDRPVVTLSGPRSMPEVEEFLRGTLRK